MFFYPMCHHLNNSFHLNFRRLCSALKLWTFCEDCHPDEFCQCPDCLPRTLHQPLGVCWPVRSGLDFDSDRWDVPVFILGGNGRLWCFCLVSLKTLNVKQKKGNEMEEWIWRRKSIGKNKNDRRNFQGSKLWQKEYNEMKKMQIFKWILVKKEMKPF